MKWNEINIIIKQKFKNTFKIILIKKNRRVVRQDKGKVEEKT